jgi:putative phosphoribosyl transferase
MQWFEGGMRIFRDRRSAGRALAGNLEAYAGRGDVLVLGLPRGGVPVAFEVAQHLRVPLDVFIVRKLGLPGSEELAMGAVASGGVIVTNMEVVEALRLPDEIIEAVALRESAEIARRERVYREGRPALDVAGKIVIVVDDGVATGSTVVAAAAALRGTAARVVIAAPVVASDTLSLLEEEADEVVHVMAPESFVAVGPWYADFAPVTDEQVRALLAGDGAEHPYPIAVAESVAIPLGDVTLSGDLTVPRDATGIVLFAHGAGSSRKSPRNRFVAEVLQRAGLATLLMDLLTEREEELERRTAHLRFDIDLLAGRLIGATDWVSEQASTRSLAIGYFGASTGAAAALVAAAERPVRIEAVVSRGGRPDLAGSALSSVTAPTLLVVGGSDTLVLELNRRALQTLSTEKRLEIVPGASHLFEEPGALDRVAELATDWFTEHLGLSHATIEAAPTKDERPSI